MLRLSGALPIGALVVAGCATAYGEAPGGDAGAGADSGADAVEQPPGEDVSVVTSCGAAAPNPVTVGFAGIAITNLTSTKTHVLWLAGSNMLQRIRLAPGASVETIFEAQQRIAAFVATPDFVVYAVEGGSFAVSNLGMYGVTEFSAIINPPQSAILAVGLASQRAIVVDGAIEVGTIMTVTMSADHRVLDGALAAQWLAAFVARIENPIGMLV